MSFKISPALRRSSSSDICFQGWLIERIDVMLLALSIVLSLVESVIPLFSGIIPGLKLGLANTVVLTVLYLYSFKDAIYLSLLRVILIGILRTGIFSIPFLFSLGGAFLSIIVMSIFKKTKLSIVGVSVLGSIFHSIGQIIIAFLILNNNTMFYYLPFLLIFSIPTGVITGLISKELIKYLKNKISGNSSFFANIDTLKKENEQLKEKNTKLEESLRQLEVVQAENNTLKEYLKLTDQYKEYQTVPAYIISKDVSNYSNIFVINAGKSSGLEKNMTVIAAEGLVGHIISVTDDTAKVQTLVDTSNVVSASLENSKDNVICRGTLDGNILNASYISTDTQLTEGESLHTSGMGGIYPKGIYIGKIKKIKNTKNITDRTFTVETAVNFNSLETVLVIKK